MNKNAHYNNASSFLAQLQYMSKFCGSHICSHPQKVITIIITAEKTNLVWSCGEHWARKH